MVMNGGNRDGFCSVRGGICRFGAVHRSHCSDQKRQIDVWVDFLYFSSEPEVNFVDSVGFRFNCRSVLGA